MRQKPYFLLFIILLGMLPVYHLAAQANSATTAKPSNTDEDFQSQYYLSLIESGNEIAINDELNKANKQIEQLTDMLAFLEQEKTRLKSLDFKPCDELIERATKAAAANLLTEMGTAMAQLNNACYQLNSSFFNSPNILISSFTQTTANNLVSYNLYEFGMDGTNKETTTKAKLTSASEIARIKKTFGTNNLLSLRDSIVSRVDNEINKVKPKLQASQKKILDLQKAMQRKSEINVTAIYLGLPLFCATILILFIGTQWLKLYYGSKDNGNKISTFPSAVLLEISTVLLVTLSILILGLAKLISSEVLGTLLGGISGFVLNRTKGNLISSGNETDPLPSSNSPTNQ